MFERLRRDINAVFERDPAAKTWVEVLLCYPCVRVMMYYRLSHRLYLKGHTTLARWISQRGRHVTGIEIHPGATIGEGLFIDHGDGVVIGETTVIGNNVTLYQGVTLGGTGKHVGKRHPTIGNNVVVGAGAKVLGPFTVGDNSKIGAGAIVLKEVPPNCTVVGNPGRIVRKETIRQEVDLDHVHLPDPVKMHIEALEAQVKALSEQVEKMKQENTEV
ncbi:MAG: serine O-acetyltransferase [Clostridia bacterium]|nr:serine O-acetyltransferase [Clostridia bacterium]